MNGFVISAHKSRVPATVIAIIIVIVNIRGHFTFYGIDAPYRNASARWQVRQNKYKLLIGIEKAEGTTRYS